MLKFCSVFAILWSFGLSAAPSSSGPEKLPSIAERTSGSKAYSGFLPFYWDASQGKLLIEIRRFDQEFLYGSGLASGAGVIDAFLDRGQTGTLMLARFERVGPKVLLVALQTGNRSGVSDRERTRVVTESFPTSVLAALPIAAESSGGVLVDATDFLLRDTQVLPMLRDASFKGWKEDVALSALNFDRTGAFPRNSEIEATLTFICDDPAPAFRDVLPDGHTMSLRIHHSFVALPEPGFAVREHDPRVGFFPNFYRDQTVPFTEPIERYQAVRWRLDAAHPHIVYYLDRGIPEPERSAVREAVLWWNHAFAEAGFPDALEVEDLPAGASFLDVRYSGVEWINRVERAWSVGEAQVDPRTGEIIHGVARIDSHRRRTTARIWQNLQARMHAGYCEAADAPDLSALAGEFEGVDETSLVLDRLRYLAAHEVGHTLGLDHDWAATTFGWGSVMDYLAPDIEIKNGQLDLTNAYPHDIGSYDRFAIRWGYSVDGSPRALDAIVREAYAKGIVYPLESDPRWAEYDYGQDPVEWLATTQAVRAEILKRFGLNQLAAGEPVYDLQTRLSLAYLYHRFGLQAAAQFVGGQFATSALAGDGQKPAAWVPAAQQWRAVELLSEAISPGNLDIPDSILANLVAVPSLHEKSREQFPSHAGAAFSLFDAARTLCDLVVGALTNAERDARLTLDFESGAPRLSGVFSKLIAATWGQPVADGRRMAGLSRVARRSVLDGFLRLAANAKASPEVRAEDLAALRSLRRIAASASADPDETAFRELARRDLDAFLEHPELNATPVAPTQAPPGRPIGEPGT